MAKRIYYVFDETIQRDVVHNGGDSGWTEKQLLKAIETNEIFMFCKGHKLVVHCFRGCEGSLNGKVLQCSEDVKIKLPNLNRALPSRY